MHGCDGCCFDSAEIEVMIGTKEKLLSSAIAVSKVNGIAVV
jgi:hypothetical protein